MREQQLPDAFERRVYVELEEKAKEQLPFLLAAPENGDLQLRAHVSSSSVRTRKKRMPTPRPQHNPRHETSLPRENFAHQKYVQACASTRLDRFQ